MSTSRARKLPAFVLAALFLVVSGQASALAQDDATAAPRPEPVADEKKTEVASAPALLTQAERDFFNPHFQPATREWESDPLDKSCSCFLALDSQPGEVASVSEDAQPQQQPTTAQYTPLTPGQKMRRSFKGAFLSPSGYIRTGISAAITEATEEDLPHKDTDDRVADGLSRFAIRFSTRATRTIFGSGIYPILFKQDPRYERSTSKSFTRRALHAVSRVFVTRGDGGDLQPNYSRFAGSFTASAIANLWEQSTPGRDRIGWDATFRRFASSIPDDMLNNLVFREFLPDIIRIFKRK